VAGSYDETASISCKSKTFALTTLNPANGKPHLKLVSGAPSDQCFPVTEFSVGSAAKSTFILLLLGAYNKKITVRIEDLSCLIMSQKLLGVTSTFAVLWAFIAVACHRRSLHSVAVLFSMAHLLGCVG
jgi:hypothetical protein